MLASTGREAFAGGGFHWGAANDARHNAHTVRVAGAGSPTVCQPFSLRGILKQCDCTIYEMTGNDPDEDYVRSCSDLV